MFTVPRCILLLRHLDEVQSVPADILWNAMLMGFRFDSVISAYIHAVPLLFFIGASFFHWRNRIAEKIILWYLLITYGLALFICAADIPYFEHFNYRITISALQWIDTPGFVLSMIFNDTTYYPYLGLFFISIVLFSVLVRKIFFAVFQHSAQEIKSHSTASYSVLIMYAVLTLGIVFIGARGRIANKSPIRWGTAFFSNYPFPNQLGLNPVFTFLRSWLDERDPMNQQVHLMDENVAIRNVQNYFHINNSAEYSSPAARKVVADSLPSKKNVVLILMESVSSEMMARFGNNKNLTPALDSLAKLSSLFTNFYSAGIHTCNGIYSTLFGYPALMRKHPMTAIESLQPFDGIAQTLNENGYITAFFTTHDEEFDNMGGFLSYNGFAHIISQKDYPAKEVVGPLGVPDHIMFEQSLQHLKNISSSGNPFFATLLTGSHHGPYVIPKNILFVPDAKLNIEEQTMQYADWAIQQFLKSVQKEKWYSNTIFLFLGDHGTGAHYTSYMSLSFHHIPLIIFSPARPERKEYAQFGGQIDVYATLMGLLNITYINNSLGVDLFREHRPMMYFSADDKLGCLNEKYFLIMHTKTDLEYLLKYTENEQTDYRNDFPAVAETLRTYAKSMVQTAQWMITNKKVERLISTQNY
jgi:phosphoglycerol transferase MdoB-like AlkP superfamily enzyme